MSRVTFAVAAAAALATVAAVAGSADGQQPAGRTITLTAAPRRASDAKQIDVKPRGISVGDRTLAGQTLRDGGRPVGRLVGDCVAVDARYKGQQCVLTLIFRDGLITTQDAGLNGRLPGGNGPDQAGDRSAITGGTGAYTGASGTLLIKSGSKGDELTIALTP